MTTSINYILNYVADVPKSAALYAQIVDGQLVESSQNFAMFALKNGTALGLWARNDVEPRATLPGGNELGFQVDSDDAVHAMREAWVALGLKVIQEPTRMDFGFTFTAADPDGHRLRVFAPSAN